MKKFKVGSLFAGVGGICLGFQNAKLDDKGYELVFANEIDEYACETYRNNFKHTLLEGDIHKFLDPSLCSDEDKKEYYESRRHYLFDSKIDVLNGRCSGVKLSAIFRYLSYYILLKNTEFFCSSP